jgi:shikimate dehydrogenase
LTRVFGIVGDPIDQVRSPAVFNALFRERNVDAVMVPFHVRPSDLASALEGLRRIENLGGLIITVPHKTAAARIASKSSWRVSIAQAANALRPVHGGWEADLFDGEGFARGMEAAGYGLRGKRCAVVGCGGAGAAVALALLERDIGQLGLWDSDGSRCESLAARLRPARDIEITVRAPDDRDDIAINATPLGMDARDPLPFRVEQLGSAAIVAEVVMKPPKTRLLELASERGLRTQEGRHMLDNQVESIWEFFGLRR